MGDAVAQPVSSLSSAAASAEPFEALYRRTFPRVYAYVASLLRDRSAAEDVTAQAYERAFRKRRSFRAARGSPDAWVFGIARNAALDELRRRRRHAALESEPADVSTAAPDDEAERAFRRTAVRDALAELSGHERDIVALRLLGVLIPVAIVAVLVGMAARAARRRRRESILA